MTGEKTFKFNFLRVLTLALSVVAAVGSLYFMFNVGRNQKSIFLIVISTVWIFSPFIGFFLANKIAKRWTLSTRASLCWLMIILTFLSLVVYSGALSDKFGRKPIHLISFVIFLISYAGFAFISNLFLVGILFVFYGLFQGIFRPVGKSLELWHY